MRKTFVILANARWDSAGIGGNSSQQYARTLMRMGWEVAYLQPDDTWRIKEISEIEKNHDTVVMCDLPYLESYKRVFHSLIQSGCRSVCRIVDYWKSWESTDFFESDSFKPELEADFLKMADQVFALNPLNVTRLKSIRPDIKLLRNGVDLEYFLSNKNRDQTTLPRGTLALGVIASFWIPDWINLDPVLHYAKKYPECRVNIIGNADFLKEKGEYPLNIIFHGIKHWKDIPALIRQFDVCVVPYNPATTRYTNPTKVLEYLAGGKPVVSCHNPSIMDYPYVYFYKNSRDFEDAVDQALSNPIDKEYLFGFLKKNTWEERINIILDSLNIKGTERKLTVS